MNYQPTATPHAGRNYIVTGAGSGIGKATAIILAKEGASVAIWDVNKTALEETEKVIKSTGGKVISKIVDISDSKQTDQGVEDAIAAFGELHGAANVAAIPQTNDMRMGEVQDEEWDRIMRININGMRNCMRSEVRKLSAGASVCSVASVAGLFGQWQASAYTASKHAVIGMTKTNAKDYGPNGIRFNCIAPAAVDTPMLRAGLKGYTIDDVAAMAALKRISQPEEMAHPISFLLSPLSSYITGTTLLVDGGFLA